MERLILLLLFFTIPKGYTQTKAITKKELKTLIREGLTNNKQYSWEICGDSVFSKSDTIYIHTPYNNTCANFISWHFANNNHASQTSTKRTIHISTSGWREYTFEGKPITPANFYKIKFKEEKGTLLLQRYNKHKLIDSYMVLAYHEKQKNGEILMLIKQ